MPSPWPLGQMTCLICASVRGFFADGESWGSGGDPRRFLLALFGAREDADECAAEDLAFSSRNFLSSCASSAAFEVSAATFFASRSTHTTSFPESAKQVPATSPTYPAPMTEMCIGSGSYQLSAPPTEIPEGGKQHALVLQQSRFEGKVRGGE